MTEMRPDPDSDLAGAASEYGDDTGFAAEATRTSSPDSGTATPDDGSDEIEDTTLAAGPGDGGD